MVNNRLMRVSPDFRDLMLDIGRKTNLSPASVTKIVAIQLKTNQMEIEVPRMFDNNRTLVKFKKVKIKQNGGLGLIDLL